MDTFKLVYSTQSLRRKARNNRHISFIFPLLLEQPFKRTRLRQKVLASSLHHGAYQPRAANNNRLKESNNVHLSVQELDLLHSKDESAITLFRLLTAEVVTPGVLPHLLYLNHLSFILSRHLFISAPNGICPWGFSLALG